MEKAKLITIWFGVIVLLAAGVVWLFFYRPANKGGPAPAIYRVAYLNNNGDYVEAQNFILEQMKNDSSPDLKLLLAASYLDEGTVRGRQAEASKKAQDILFEIEKTYQGVYLYDLIGYSFELAGDFNNALGYYNRSLMIDSKSVNTLFGIGHTYFLKGDLAKAKEYFDKAEKSITKSTDNSVITKVYTAQGRINIDPRKSEEYFVKALPLADSRAFKSELYSNLSHVKYLQNDFPKAVSFADLAIKTDPSNESGYIAYAKATMSDKDLLQKNAQRVEEYLVKAIFLAPYKAESQYWMGKFDVAFGKNDLAIKSYDTAVKFIPNDDTLNMINKQVLMSDVLFDESIVLYLEKDAKYKTFFIEAFKLNPVKTLFRIRANPALKEMMKDFVSKKPK